MIYHDSDVHVVISQAGYDRLKAEQRRNCTAIRCATAIACVVVGAVYVIVTILGN